MAVSRKARNIQIDEKDFALIHEALIREESACAIIANNEDRPAFKRQAAALRVQQSKSLRARLAEGVYT